MQLIKQLIQLFLLLDQIRDSDIFIIILISIFADELLFYNHSMDIEQKYCQLFQILIDKKIVQSNKLKQIKHIHNINAKDTNNEYTQQISMHNEKYDNILNLHQSDQKQNAHQSYITNHHQILLNSFDDLNIQINEQIKNKYVPIELIHQSINSVVVKCKAIQNTGKAQENQNEVIKLANEQVKQSNYSVVKISKSAKHEAQAYKKLSKIGKPMHFANMYEHFGDSIVIEYCEGNLRDMITNNEAIINTTIFKLLYHCTLAFKQLEKISIIHSDIKPQNILYQGKNEDDIIFVVTDFGSSFNQQANKKTSIKECRQTWCYRAPQWHNSQQECMVDRKIDVWGLGCVLFQCLTAQYLMPADIQNQEQYQKCLGAYASKEEITKRLARFAIPSQMVLFQQLLLMLLKINPKERLSIYQVQHQVEKIHTLLI